MLLRWLVHPYHACQFSNNCYNHSSNVSISGNIESENDKNYKITASIDNRRHHVVDIDLL